MCVVYPSCPFVVVLLSILRICDVTTTALFSTHRRVPALKSTGVRHKLDFDKVAGECPPPCSIVYTTSEMKNSNSGYTRTSTILVSKQKSVYPGTPINLYQKMIPYQYILALLLAGMISLHSSPGVMRDKTGCKTDRRDKTDLILLLL